MTRTARKAALLSLSLAVCATALIAAGLPRLVLEPGMPRPELRRGTLALPPAGEQARAGAPVSRILLVVLCVVLAATLAWMAVRFLRGVDWKGLGKDLLRGLLLGAALCGLVVLLTLTVPESAIDLGAAPPIPVEVATAHTPLGDPPALVLWMTAALLVLAAGLVLAGWLRPSRRRHGALVEIAAEAERAHQALLAGASGPGVILACYRGMTRAVAEGRGVERATSMTAREFEQVLGGLGLPRTPVEELTRLFEAARYGDRTQTPDQEARAIACLSPIVEFCRRARRGS